MFNQQILELLEEFKPRDEEPVRSARRPAGESLLIETQTYDSGTSFYLGLADFWLHALSRFQQDSGSDELWLRGLAYQSDFSERDADQFLKEYSAIQQRLTLPPPEIIELQKAYRVLQGRVISYCGITSDGEYWAGTYGPGYFQ